MIYRAVIFDLDGTLLDTLSDLATAVNRVLRQEGYPEHVLQEYRMLVGGGVHTLMRRALPAEARENESVVALAVEGFFREYEKCWHDQSRLYEGLPAVLDKLAEQQIPMAILSNKPHAFTLRCAEHFLTDWPFQEVLGQREGIAHKPDPAGALEIAHQLQIAPSDCLYVGDSSVDMQTATAAGMLPLGVSWGFRTREELIEHGARWVIDHPAEMLTLQ